MFIKLVQKYSSFSMSVSQRAQVLSLYKRILRLGKNWKSKENSPADTIREQNYIINEAQRLFRQNASLQSQEEIRGAVKEAESRVEIAVHYQNPWPRPSHIPQHSMLPPTSRRKKKSDSILKKSKPAYIKSYDIGDKTS